MRLQIRAWTTKVTRWIELLRQPALGDLTAAHAYRIAKKRRFPSTGQLWRFSSVLSSRERALWYGAWTCVAASLVLSFGLYAFSHRELSPAVGGDYTEGLVGEPQYINPLFAPGSTVDMDLTRLVFRGLFKLDQDAHIVPDLATSVEQSEDKKTYTVKLHENAKWHDGTPLTARDVAFTISAIQNEQYRSPLRGRFQGVSVESKDDHTAVFILTEPSSAFLSALTVGIVPAHVWEGVAPKRAILASTNIQPVGNGPYRFEKYTKDQNGVIRSYTLKRFSGFYGEKPKLDTLTIKFYAKLDDALSALENRNVEGVGFLPEDEAPAFEENRFVELLRPTIPEQHMVFWNDTRQAIFKEAAVRQALALSVDRSSIAADVFHGHATVLFGPVFPGDFPGMLPTVSQDVAKATETLEKAGWIIPEGETVRQKDLDKDKVMEKLAFELVVVDTPNLVATAEKLKAFWSAIGVDVTVRTVARETYASEILKTRAYDALLGSILYGADHDPFPFWHSSQKEYPGGNVALYGNRKADEAIDEMRTAKTPQDRGKAITKFHETLTTDEPALFLVSPRYTYPISSKIQGVVMHAIAEPADRWNSVETWYTKTKKRVKLPWVR